MLLSERVSIKEALIRYEALSYDSLVPDDNSAH